MAQDRTPPRQGYDRWVPPAFDIPNAVAVTDEQMTPGQFAFYRNASGWVPMLKAPDGETLDMLTFSKAAAVSSVAYPAGTTDVFFVDYTLPNGTVGVVNDPSKPYGSGATIYITKQHSVIIARQGAASRTSVYVSFDSGEAWNATITLRGSVIVTFMMGIGDTNKNVSVFGDGIAAVSGVFDTAASDTVSAKNIKLYHVGINSYFYAGRRIECHECFNASPETTALIAAVHEAASGGGGSGSGSGAVLVRYNIGLHFSHIPNLQIVGAVLTGYTVNLETMVGADITSSTLHNSYPDEIV